MISPQNKKKNKFRFFHIKIRDKKSQMSFLVLNMIIISTHPFTKFRFTTSRNGRKTRFYCYDRLFIDLFLESLVLFFIYLFLTLFGLSDGNFFFFVLFCKAYFFSSLSFGSYIEFHWTFILCYICLMICCCCWWWSPLVEHNFTL